MDKVEALKKHLIDKREFSAKELDIEIESTKYDDSIFEVHGREYMVLTDSEATERAIAYCKDSVWAFSPDFMAAYMPDGVDSDVLEILQEKCEGCNDALIGMLGDRLNDMIGDAISCDGRAHFLNTYDGNEYEVDEYFIYRIN